MTTRLEDLGNRLEELLMEGHLTNEQIYTFTTLTICADRLDHVINGTPCPHYENTAGQLAELKEKVA